MQLLVAYKNDPAGSNMANFLSKDMKKDGEIFKENKFDLAIIPSPAISADWIDKKYHYDGYVFLSKHVAESGVLALTCHSTGNFAKAEFGGKKRQVAIPHPYLQKEYLQSLWRQKENFSKFQITIEATHHGPTDIDKPVLFIEIGTTQKQWTDTELCSSVAKIVSGVMQQEPKTRPVAICFGGTHYPDKFTTELLDGEFALGTVMPKHALEFLDGELFSHILQRNDMAKAVLLDWSGLGQYKQKLLEFISSTDLEVVKL